MEDRAPLPALTKGETMAGCDGQSRASSASSRNFGKFSGNCKGLKCATSHNFGRKFDGAGPGERGFRNAE